MKLLFVSYWGIEEGLSEATVIPHLKILAGFKNVEKIIFCSIERTGSQTRFTENSKVIHEPLISRSLGNTFLTKTADFVSFPKKLESLCREHQIDLIICRSSLAGALGYRVFKRTGIPYVVESFEPHAEYMIESHTWNKFGYRAWIQKRLERLQLETASFLVPVSGHYTNRLVQEGINQSRIMTLPCCISIDDFSFNGTIRTQKRNELKIPETDVVGIYVGKYGDIYYTDEAYDLYKEAFNFFQGKFRLILLTGEHQENLRQQLQKRGIPPDRVWIGKVAHAEVPHFLSAADFAFSTIRPSPSRIYCSPIKNGEYWANGLPVLLEPGIGEDSDIIATEGGGVILHRTEPQQAFQSLLDNYISKGRPAVAKEIEPVARRHRSMDLVQEVYATMLRKLGFS
jgi:hypothetical protein